MSATAATIDRTRSQALRGLAWKSVSVVVLQVSRSVTAIILARLLTPVDYGLAGMVLVVSTLVYVFADLGMGAALVQRKELTEHDRSTVFWFTVASGAVFTLIGIAVSGLVADFYGEPQVAGLFAAFSLCFLITALSSTHAALLTREMSFRTLELRQMISYAAGAAIGIFLAWRGYGAWALIGQQLAVAVAATLVLIVATPWRPRLIFSLDSLRTMGRFGGNVFGARMLFYANRNTDNVLIGRFIGPAGLGAYSLGYNVMLMPFNQIAAPIQEVLLPAFARWQDEPKRIAAIWLRANRLVAAISVPSLLGLIVVTPEFVHAILGDRWHSAIPVIRILCWVGLLQSLQRMNGNILQARERPGLLFRYSVVSLVASVIAFVIGLPWGVVGVAAGYAVSCTFVEPYYTWLTARTLDIGLPDVARSLFGVFQASIVMTVCVIGAKLVLVDQGASSGIRLLLLILVGAAVYLPLCLWRAPEVATEIRALLARRRGVDES
jgi:O-antigen/teichoic acid export membrane protein